jgi:hypothetical protein
MNAPSPVLLRPMHFTRPQAIAAIREKLAAMCDDEHCACEAAAHLGVFCRGFRDLPDAALRGRFDWIARSRPGISRNELERLISLYHVARQQVGGFQLCCDAETREHCACDGWTMFDNAFLEKTCKDLTGRDAVVD